MTDTVKTPGPSRHLAWGLFAASVLAALSSVYFGVEQQHYQDCQSRVNDSFTRSLQARTSAAEQDRNAMDVMVQEVSLAKTADDTRAALQKYRDTRAKADEERKKNPLPRPASEVCR